MDDVTLSVASRDLQSGKFRASSEDVPGVLYGKDQEARNISVPVNVLEKTFHMVGGSKVIDLVIDEEKPVKVLFQDIQSDPVSGRPIHFDMYAVTLGQKMRTEVPLRFEGQPSLVASGEGILVTIKNAIEVEANPLNLPEFIEVNLEELTELGQTILVSDLKTPKDSEIITDGEEAVVKLDVPREEEPEEEETEVAEGEEATEGEAEEATSDEASEEA